MEADISRIQDQNPTGPPGTIQCAPSRVSAQIMELSICVMGNNDIANGLLQSVCWWRHISYDSHTALRGNSKESILGSLIIGKIRSE